MTKIELSKPLPLPCETFKDNINLFLNVLNGVIAAVELYDNVLGVKNDKKDS